MDRLRSREDTRDVFFRQRACSINYNFLRVFCILIKIIYLYLSDSIRVRPKSDTGQTNIASVGPAGPTPAKRITRRRSGRDRHTVSNVLIGNSGSRRTVTRARDAFLSRGDYFFSAASCAVPVARVPLMPRDNSAYFRTRKWRMRERERERKERNREEGGKRTTGKKARAK